MIQDKASRESSKLYQRNLQNSTPQQKKYQLHIQGQQQTDQEKTSNLLYKRRMSHIMLSIVITILSTLWVQIAMYRFAPYIRAAQCYFNEIVLLHNSQDIYQGTDVVYWRTAQYYRYQDLIEMFGRLNQTIYELEDNSLFQMDAQQKLNAQLLVKYGNPKTGTTKTPSFYQANLVNLTNLFQQTFLNRSFYQHYWKSQMTFQIPIIFRNSSMLLQIKLQSQVYSSLLIDIKMNLQLLDYEKKQIQPDHPKLEIRKMHNPKDMSLSIPFLVYIIVGLLMILLFLELTTIAEISKKIDKKHREAIIQQLKIQKLIDQCSPSLDSSISSLGDQLEDSITKKIRIPRKYKLTFYQKAQRIGFYRLFEVTITGICLFLCSYSVNGVICCLFWIKITLYLGQTKGKYMVGFLFQETLPVYMKIFIFIAICMTAFVMFNLLVFTNTKKFQSLQLSYFQYLFNIFQYGIYQNFIKGFRSQGLLAQFFYFVQIFFLLYIGNNILTSILSNQVMKRSYVETIGEMLDQIQMQCPACGAAPAKQQKMPGQFVKTIAKSQPGLLSKLIKNNKFQDSAWESGEQYILKIQSPLLAPFFPEANQKKKKQKFLSPKLKGGQFEKHLKQMQKKAESNEISNSKIQQVNKLKKQYSKDKKITNVEITQSQLKDTSTQNNYHKKIKAKLAILYEEVRKLDQIKQSAGKLMGIQSFSEVKKTVLLSLLQRIDKQQSNLKFKYQ